jgi:hypothetical protein
MRVLDASYRKNRSGGFRKSESDTLNLPRVPQKSAEARPEHQQVFDSEISIAPIEILNCTFHPKPLYQRYIQVVVREKLRTSGVHS